MVLCIKSSAPAIKVDGWLTGQPLTKFQAGKVYIVEFWKTCCGLCVATMPHLVQLQEKCKGRGLEVVGAAALQQASTADEARAKLDLRLNVSKGNSIAFDYSGEMNKLWMDPSLSPGISDSSSTATAISPYQLSKTSRSCLAEHSKGIWRTSHDIKVPKCSRARRANALVGQLRRAGSQVGCGSVRIGI